MGLHAEDVSVAAGEGAGHLDHPASLIEVAGAYNRAVSELLGLAATLRKHGEDEHAVAAFRDAQYMEGRRDRHMLKLSQSAAANE